MDIKTVEDSFRFLQWYSVIFIQLYSGSTKVCWTVVEKKMINVKGLPEGYSKLLEWNEILRRGNNVKAWLKAPESPFCMMSLLYHDYNGKFLGDWKATQTWSGFKIAVTLHKYSCLVSAPILSRCMVKNFWEWAYKLPVFTYILHRVTPSDMKVVQ